MKSLIDKNFHLAKTEEGAKLTEFELLLWSLFYGFTRWQEDCEKVANQTGLDSKELSILHIIRIQNRAKTSNELMRLLNRDDGFNVTYILKKLIENGFIKKVASDKNKKTLSYEITEKGIKNTDTYAVLREDILIELFAKEHKSNIDILLKVLSGLITLYEKADRMVLANIRRGESTIEK